MYPIDSPFWEKMYFITLVAGIYIFIDTMFWLIPSMKRDFRNFIRNAKENYHADIERTKEILKYEKNY